MPANKFTRKQIEYLIQFIHPDKLLPWSTAMDDGLHPSLAGQKAIVKALVERLNNG